MRKFLGLYVPAVLALLSGLAGSPIATARGAFHLLSYHGLRIVVPASWPVYQLRSRSSVCVRFDRHAVYLGQPGPYQRCPAHAAGRTEAILLMPLAARSARSAGVGPLLPSVGSPGAAPSSARLAIPVPGVLATVTWANNPEVVARALGLRSSRLFRAARASGGLGTSAQAARSTTVHGALHPTAASPTFTGLGFDACSAPSPGQMSAWSASPYRAVGIYIGGTNMACAQPDLTSSWVSAESAAGWHLIPTYVGLQAPTNTCGCAPITPSHASAQGTAAAVDAVTQARTLGIGGGNPIYFDMEAYSRGGSSTAVVLAFLAGWTSQLHADGYTSGVYGSAASGISDLVGAVGTGYTEPDDIWIAHWNGQQTTSDSYVPGSDWPSHQRLHQYQGAHNATYGGVTINIDSNYLDGATAGAPPVLPDGTFVQVAGAAAIYRIAGGAPLYVSDWTAFGGPQPDTLISQQEFDSLRPVPADGTFLVTSIGAVYRVAGGAPLLVSNWSAFAGVQPTVTVDQWDIDNTISPLAHLRTRPADGTFLTTTTGQVYRVAGGTPFAITKWSLFGGVQASVTVDQWDLDNLSNPSAHLAAQPTNGTKVQGLPSRSYWLFSAGGRKPVHASHAAVQVDDAGLAGFPLAYQPPPPRCVVPRLRRMTLAQAKRALRRAHCHLGMVHRPRHASRIRPLRVVRQSAPARSRHRPAYAVDVTLA